MKPLSPELAAALDGLMSAVEGVVGAIEYGTFRGERGTRLKDTPEWVTFYLVWNRVKRDGEAENTPRAEGSSHA